MLLKMFYHHLSTASYDNLGLGHSHDKDLCLAHFLDTLLRSFRTKVFDCSFQLGNIRLRCITLPLLWCSISAFMLGYFSPYMVISTALGAFPPTLSSSIRTRKGRGPVCNLSNRDFRASLATAYSLDT